MRDRPRAAVGNPLPVFPEGGCGDSGLVRVSIRNGLGRVSSHGTKVALATDRSPGSPHRDLASGRRGHGDALGESMLSTTLAKNSSGRDAGKSYERALPTAGSGRGCRTGVAAV